MRTSGSKNIAQTLNSRSQEEGFIWIVIEQWNIYHDNVGMWARGHAVVHLPHVPQFQHVLHSQHVHVRLAILCICLNNNVDEKQYYFQGFDDHGNKQL